MKRIKAEEPNLVITCTANCNDNIVVGHNKIIYVSVNIIRNANFESNSNF